VASRAISGSLMTSTGALRIGGNSVWGQFFRGRIDEVRIYNRALTATEIQADKNKALGTTPSGALMVHNPQLPLKSGPTLGKVGSAAALTGNAKQSITNASLAPRESTTLTTAELLLTADDLEVGELAVDHQWKRVEFSKSFEDPVVVAKTLSYR
jgi:hypothetical protein